MICILIPKQRTAQPRVQPTRLRRWVSGAICGHLVLGKGLFSRPFSLSLDWLDRPRVAGGLVEHFQRITINTAPSGTYLGGNLSLFHNHHDCPHHIRRTTEHRRRVSPYCKTVGLLDSYGLIY